jgi:hypothetical protein
VFNAAQKWQTVPRVTPHSSRTEVEILLISTMPVNSLSSLTTTERLCIADMSMRPLMPSWRRILVQKHSLCLTNGFRERFKYQLFPRRTQSASDQSRRKSLDLIPGLLGELSEQVSDLYLIISATTVVRHFRVLPSHTDERLARLGPR